MLTLSAAVRMAAAAVLLRTYHCAKPRVCVRRTNISSIVSSACSAVATAPDKGIASLTPSDTIWRKTADESYPVLGLGAAFSSHMKLAAAVTTSPKVVSTLYGYYFSL